MKYFLDTEFIETPNLSGAGGNLLFLLSIGIVRDDDHYLYLEWKDAPLKRANEWVKANVLPHLKGGPWSVSWPSLKAAVLDFVGDDPKPEFWGYYADYDWVLFCGIFGLMVDLPKGFPMYCRDLKQWCDMLGNPELPKQESTEHNALNDARWNRRVWEFLRSEERAHVDRE